MGQAMGHNLTHNIVKNIQAFPSCRRLGQDTNEYSLRPFLQDNSSTIAEIQRINVGDILSDFESEITATAASVQIRQILPAFHGCTILLPKASM